MFARLVLVATAAVATSALEAPPIFVLNTSLPPRQRWKGALSLVLAKHDYASGFGAIFAYHNASLFSKLPVNAWGVLATSIETHWPEQADELRGVADEFAAVGHPEVSFDYLAGWVWFHALAHSSVMDRATAARVGRECTALLARDADGHTLHVGNMDQAPSNVRNVTLHIKFVRGDGSELFSGVDWYWITTGVSRAVRGGVGSVQENWRTSSPIPIDKMLADIAAGPSRATPQM